MQSGKVKLTGGQKEPYFVYLPDEGLQGEEIPSNITWSDLNVASVVVNFEKPFQVQAVFNAANPVITDNEVIVKNIEVDGYLGLLFKTNKVAEIETKLLIKYVLTLTNGEIIKVEKSISLFRPQLRVKLPQSITIEHNTGFVKGRLNVKNIGRGLLLIQIKNAEKSVCKIKAPLEYQEFAEKVNNDLISELSNLAEMFPQFQPYISYFLNNSEKKYLDLTEEAKEELKQNVSGLTTLLASDKALLRAFAESYVRAVLKNKQYEEIFRKVIMVYESLVTENILLLNPLDELLLKQKDNTIKFEIMLTDNVYDDYKNIELPEIIIKAEPNTKVPIHRIIDWR